MAFACAKLVALLCLFKRVVLGHVCCCSKLLVQQYLLSTVPEVGVDFVVVFTWMLFTKVCRMFVCIFFARSCRTILQSIEPLVVYSSIFFNV